MACYQVISLIALGLTLLATSSSAWWFSRRYPSARARGKDVDKNCLAKALQGSCDFYECFEKRLPCGRNWYNEKYGQPYCRDFEAYSSKFSPKGQVFLNASQKCITNDLISWYERESMNCHDYTHFAFKALARCFMKTDFCDVVKTDGLYLVSIFRPQHLFQRGALKIWREILRIAFHCEPENFQRMIAYFWESFTSY